MAKARNSDGLKIHPRSTIFDAMKAINANFCEVVFVVDSDDRLLGVVTDGDIRRGLLASLGFESPITEIMKRGYVSVREGTDRNSALDLMKARTIRHLPILDAEGKLKGVHLLRELIGAQERPNAAMILAGGRGSRLGSLTEDLPKPMLKVADRPILERIIFHLVGSGIRRIYLSVNYKADVIKTYFGDGTLHGCEIRYLEEESPLGTAGPLSLMPRDCDFPILVMNGDLITQFDVDNLFSFHEKGGYELTLCSRQHQVDIPFGVITQDNGRFKGIEEKPSRAFLVSAGIYVVNCSVLETLRQGEREDMPDLIGSLNNAGKPIGVYQLDSEWIDIGRHEDLDRAKGLTWP